MRTAFWQALCASSWMWLIAGCTTQAPTAPGPVAKQGDPAASAPKEPGATSSDVRELAPEEFAATTQDNSPGESQAPDRLPANSNEAAKPPDPPDRAAATSVVAEEGPSDELFANWTKPQLLLVISGEQMGYIEPCGCAGLENQKGGLGRRHTFLKQLDQRGWPRISLDLGNQVRRFGAQQEIKFHTTIEALRTMRYSAIGFGPDDLRLPVGELLADAAGDESAFVSANVSLTGFEELIPKFRIAERGGWKVGITAVLGESHWNKIKNADLSFVPAERALAEVVQQVKPQADFLVLLSYASQAESRALAEKFPQFHIVVTAGGADEPPLQPHTLNNSPARLVEVGHKGMYLAVAGLFDDAEDPVRFQRVPLDKRFAASDEMHDLLVAYQGQLRERGFDGLGLQPIAHPSGRSFAGSQKCAECHTMANQKWSETPHAHATETLVKLDPPRQFDPECVSCHAIGWSPQKYFPYKSGFASLMATPHLQNNGCENCHGPGSAHAAAESGDVQATQQQLGKLREQMRLPLANAEAVCRTCHDADNSPAFDFEKYWPDVEHRGKD